MKMKMEINGKIILLTRTEEISEIDQVISWTGEGVLARMSCEKGMTVIIDGKELEEMRALRYFQLLEKLGKSWARVNN
jgi:hypothetical protein